MTEKNAIFGNPWHGKLAAGTIELVPGTPVSSITVDGETFSVQSVSGNLGDTRYLRSPDLPDPPVITAVSALNGEFKRDAVIYSDSFRWSPLSAIGVLETKYHWLLWDGTAQAWRKMKIQYAWQTLSTSSLAGSDCCYVTVWRGPLAGRLNRVESQDYVQIADFMLPYTYATDPRRRPSAAGYDPAGRQLSIEARRDGRRFVLRIAAKRVDPIDPDVSVGFPPGYVIWDTTATYLFDVFEVVLSDDGSSAATPGSVWPPAGPVKNPRTVWSWAVSGDLYWDAPALDEGYPGYVWTRYFVPLTMTSTMYAEASVYTSGMLTASYDKDGVLRLPTYEAISEVVSTGVITGDYVLAPHPLAEGRVYFPETDDPADHIPAYSVDTSEHEGDVLAFSTYSDLFQPLSGTFASSARDYAYTSSDEVQHTVRIIDGADTLKTWSSPIEETIAFHDLTNNVVDIRTAAASLIRVGPGKVHDGSMSLPVYATFDHRAEAVYSSAAPVGVV